jgi:ParB family chromosome partitioning protein
MGMADEPQRPTRLGRGLAALIGDQVDENTIIERGRGQRVVPLAFIRPNPNNPRRHFDEEELDELAASIKEKGIIQPIVVRMGGKPDSYEIIAGERRWRAAQKAGLHDVPVVLVEANDREALELAIIENVQRSDLNALEEAAGYEQLIAQFSYSQTDLAKIVGKSRSHVANTIRLGKLPPLVKGMVSAGEVSAGHARALLAVSDPESIAKKIVTQGLTVRDVERIAQQQAAAPETKAEKPARREKDADTRALEHALAEVLGLAVAIEHKDSGGSVVIRYKTLDQLDALCRRLQAR